MKKFLGLFVVIGVLAGGWWVWHGQNEGAVNGSGQAAAFDKHQSSLDEPASVWVVVNKHRPVQSGSYMPTDLTVPPIPLRLPGNTDEMLLRSEAAFGLGEMSQAAKQAGRELMVASAYRSHNYQKGLYNGYVKREGQAAADTQSARPGYSEHQTGLAVDLEPVSRKCEVEACFADTPEGKWLAENAYKYGFIIRYPKGKQGTTGYVYEPWHFRYVGKVLAQELRSQGNPTLEEFFGLGAAPDYQ